MARPLKQGLDYFSFDVDFFDDVKIMAISEEFNCKGEAIIIRLLCAIYRNGAYIEYNEMLERVVAKKAGVSANLVKDVVTRAIQYGFFDKSKFEEYRILTSKGIQNRYLRAKEKKQFSTIPDGYLIDVGFSPKNPVEESVFRRKMQQSKVKESKVNINNAEELIPREAEGFSAAATAESAEMDSAAGKYSTAFVEALDAIGAKFQTDGRCYARMLESLLQAIQSEHSDGLRMVYDALKRLDSAEAIKSGKVRLSITGFLKPEPFLRLLNGDYDVDYSDRPGLGLPLSTPRKRQTTKAITPPQAPGSIEDIY